MVNPFQGILKTKNLLVQNPCDISSQEIRVWEYNMISRDRLLDKYYCYDRERHVIWCCSILHTRLYRKLNPRMPLLLQIITLCYYSLWSLTFCTLYYIQKCQSPDICQVLIHSILSHDHITGGDHTCPVCKESLYENAEIYAPPALHRAPPPPDIRAAPVGSPKSRCWEWY